MHMGFGAIAKSGPKGGWTLDSFEQRAELPPALGAAHKKPRRFGQRKDQYQAEKEGDGAAHEKKPSPAVIRKDKCSQDSGEHAS